MRVRGMACLLVLAMLTACGGLRDRSGDYRIVQDMAPLTLPPGQEARPIKPLYPIPPGPVPKEWPKKFQTPAPKPLVLKESSAAQPAPASVSSVEKPVLTQDGNGYPLLSIAGDFNVLWDRLDASLRRAGIKPDDRDQRVGLYYLSLPGETDKDKKVAYQLRVARGQSAYTLTLQKDDDTLAPQATARTLFEAIVNHWPEPEPTK